MASSIILTYYLLLISSEILSSRGGHGALTFHDMVRQLSVSLGIWQEAGKRARPHVVVLLGLSCGTNVM